MRVFNNIAILIRAYRHIMVSNRNTVEYVSAGIGIWQDYKNLNDANTMYYESYRYKLHKYLGLAGLVW